MQNVNFNLSPVSPFEHAWLSRPAYPRPSATPKPAPRPSNGAGSRTAEERGH
jgi:hypothetical protein